MISSIEIEALTIQQTLGLDVRQLEKIFSVWPLDAGIQFKQSSKADIFQGKGLQNTV